MIHLPALITDLGFILVTAAIVTLIFKKLKQPLVLGYLIAGFLVSRHVPWFPTIEDEESVRIWAEIGVIFLLFGLGLEFSFKKLVKVGGTAGFTAVFEVVFMVGLGYLTGLALGWNSTDSLFLGAILSVSSTTIIVRAFQELGLKGQRFVEFVFGILIVEDIVAVLLLVLLPSMVSKEGFSFWNLLMVSVRMLFFVILWFVVGIFAIPPMLKKIRSLLEEETTLIVAIGLCFLMVMIASHAGFSPALGAFVMGSLLAETPEGHRMEELLNPVKNLFAAVFFVSVGMMIDPTILIAHWDLILILTAVTILGKFLSTYLGALITGQERRIALQSGMSLAQIGEFSFIIATLGMSLKVTSDFLYPLAVAVSAVTTFTTPYLIKSSDVFFKGLDSVLPGRLKSAMDQYANSMHREGRQGVVGILLRRYGVAVLLNSVVIAAVIYLFKIYILSVLEEHLSGVPLASGLALFLCLLLSAPFFWGLLQGQPKNLQEEDLRQLQEIRGAIWGVTLVRALIALALLSAMIVQFIPYEMAWGLVGIILVAAVFFSLRYGGRLYNYVERKFLLNLTAKERKELSKMGFGPGFLPWKASMESFELGVFSGLSGKTLREVAFKEKYGVTIASVTRGGKKSFAPTGDFVLWPLDKVVCFGSEEELRKIRQEISKEATDPAWPEDSGDYKLRSFVIDEQNSLCNKSIKNSGLRQDNQVLIVGVERGEEKFLGPDSEFVLKAKDLVWVVSE